MKPLQKSIEIKKRSTRIKKGNQIPDELRTDYEIYKKNVWKITNTNNLSLLENYHKRSKRGYHLDHKYSIFQGFKDNIPPYIIGSKYNIKMLPAKENCSKKEQCSISKYELFF